MWLVGAFETLKVISRSVLLWVMQVGPQVFSVATAWDGITSRIRARSPLMLQSQSRDLLSVLGTTFSHKEPETRNKGSSSDVAKAVCHGNIRE